MTCDRRGTVKSSSHCLAEPWDVDSIASSSSNLSCFHSETDTHQLLTVSIVQDFLQHHTAVNGSLIDW